jgi:two-component system nitrogen regulation sensor histidine kinase NtrY
VARRIAHEIKNPLTPIQLSAERIRRKYGAHITTDREVFDNCIATIVRHVGDIGRMVDEFSSFARMPRGSENQDLSSVVKGESCGVSSAERHYRCRNWRRKSGVSIRRRLVTQAVTNLVKNAREIGTAKHRCRQGVSLVRPRRTRLIFA